MGWWGNYVGTAPKGQERINAVIREEGYNGENEQFVWKVLATALRGTTVYLAVERTEKATGERIVWAEVCLTSMRDGYLMVKAMTETMGPCECDCPKRILDLLTPAKNEWAQDWRKRCEEKRKTKVADKLAKLPIGAKVKRKDTGAVLVKYQYRQRKVYVDWKQSRYMTPAQLRRVGYEIME